MKKYYFVLTLLLTLSLQAQTVKSNDDRALGEKLFKSRGCTMCHKKDISSVGPSISNIADWYSGKERELFFFLKGKQPPIVNPNKSHIMKGQLLKLKILNDKKLKAITRYIITINDREF